MGTKNYFEFGGTNNVFVDCTYILMHNACYSSVFDSGLGLSQSDILLIGGLVPFLSFPASPIIGKLDKGYQIYLLSNTGFRETYKE